MSCSEESNLCPPPILFEEIVVKRPKHFVYVLTQDGEHVCFSSSIDGIKKVIDARVALLRLNYIGHNVSKDEYNSDDNTVNVYTEYSNFLFRYFRIVSQFEILRVPHFRYELSKNNIKKND